MAACGGDSRLLMTLHARWNRAEGDRQLAALEVAERARGPAHPTVAYQRHVLNGKGRWRFSGEKGSFWPRLWAE